MLKPNNIEIPNAKQQIPGEKIHAEESKPKQSSPRVSNQNTNNNQSPTTDLMAEWEHAKATLSDAEINDCLLKGQVHETLEGTFLVPPELLTKADEVAKHSSNIKKIWKWMKPSKEKEFEADEDDNDQFLLFQDAFQHIEARKSVAMKKLPPGLHKRTNFVIENKNLKKYLNGKDFRHPRCDAGAFKKPSSKCKVWERLDASKFKERTDLSFDVKKRTIIKMGTIISAKEASELYVSKQVWGRLKRDKRFKKKITYILEAPDVCDDLRKFCLVEYTGTIDEEKERPAPMGNANVNPEEHPYLRTDPETLEAALDYAIANPGCTVNQILTKFFNPTTPDESLRGRAQAEYILHKAKVATGTTSNQNVCVQINEVITRKRKQMPDFIQSVQWLDGNSDYPIIICFQKWQIKAIKKYCRKNSKRPSVVGVDKTYRVGKAFLTQTCFQIKDLKRLSTKRNPIFLGPALLHFDSTEKVYKALMTAMNNAIDELITKDAGDFECAFEFQKSQYKNNILMGSDDEKALTNAIGKNHALKK